MTTLSAYVIIGIFMFVESRLRQGNAAKSRTGGVADQNSTNLIGRAFAVMFIMLLLSPLLNALAIGTIYSGGLAWAGVIFMLGGFGVRVWASRTLGAFYTRTLLVQSEQHVVDSGPYRLIRNPGYLGDLVMFISAGVAVQNGVSLLIIAAAMISAYIYRIRTEEMMLQTVLGNQYTIYKAKTWRLIPFLY